MSYYKEHINQLLEGKSDDELKRIIESLVPAKRLTLLPPLLVIDKSNNFWYLSYDLDTHYKWRKLNISIIANYFYVYPVSETKFLIQGIGPEYRGKISVYDLVKNTLTPVQIPEFDIILPFKKTSNSSIFLIDSFTQAKEIQTLEFKNSDPTKFIARNLGIAIQARLLDIKRPSDKWLIILDSNLNAYAYYRKATKYEFVRVIHGVKIACNTTKKNLLILLQEKTYFLYHFSKEGKITSYKLSETSDGTSEDCLGNNTIAIKNSLGGSYDFIIQSFYDLRLPPTPIESLTPYTQIINFKGHSPIPINNDHFVRTAKELEVWGKVNKDYKLKFLVPLENTKNVNVFPLYPTLQERKSLLKYLTPLIKIPKDLILASLEFF